MFARDVREIQLKFIQRIAGREIAEQGFHRYARAGKLRRAAKALFRAGNQRIGQCHRSCMPIPLTQEIGEKTQPDQCYGFEKADSDVW